MEIKRKNTESIKKLRKNPKFYVFSECLDKYDILETLDKSREYTFFIPLNLCFLKDITKLDKLGDEEIKKILLAHIVPQKLTNLLVNHTYATIKPNKVIKITGPKIINGKATIIKGPIVFENITIYNINEILC